MVTHVTQNPESSESLLYNLTGEEFVNLIIFKLYSFFLQNSIPKEISKSINDEAKQETREFKYDSLEKFIEEYIEGKDAKELESIYTQLMEWHRKNRKGDEGKTTEAISRIIWIIAKKAGELNDSAIKVSIHETTEVISAVVTDTLLGINSTEPDTGIDTPTASTNIFFVEKNVLLKKGVFDFEYWNNIFNNYILGLDKIIRTKGFRSPQKIKEFMGTLKEENRGSKTVFTIPIDFVKEFKFIGFYEYLLNYLNNSPYAENLAKAILENLPKFEIEGNIKAFTDLQDEVFTKAEELIQQK